MQAFTLGHSTRSADEFVDLLKAYGIKELVDIRRFPGSRRFPHFHKDALAERLSSEGILYRHEPRLGGRRKPGEHSPNDYWQNASFRAFADYMRTDECQAAISDLVKDIADHRLAIMCSEAVHWRCHRQLVADSLVARGVEVIHIQTPSRADVHVLNSHAEVEPDGRIIYSMATQDSHSA